MENILEINGLTKTFGGLTAVSDNVKKIKSKKRFNHWHTLGHLMVLEKPIFI